MRVWPHLGGGVCVWPHLGGGVEEIRTVDSQLVVRPCCAEAADERESGEEK